MHRRISRSLYRVAFFGLLGFLAGCNVNCTRTCNKLLACDLNDGVLLLDECEEGCLRQETLYELWEDEAKETALVDHQRCILGATCDELREGVCYEAELFPFAEDDA